MVHNDNEVSGRHFKINKTRLMKWMELIWKWKQKSMKTIMDMIRKTKSCTNKKMTLSTKYDKKIG